MEPPRLGALPVSDTHRFPIGPIVFGVIGAVIAVWITVAVVTDRDPEETVEDYLTAIAEKDVEGALELVSRYGSGVPYGDEAVFLTPEAISDDWWVVSVREIEREYSTKARVEAVIAGPGGTAEGEFTVQEDDDRWLVSDPFVRVRFPPSPLSYIQVNDKIVPHSSDLKPYLLFPGPYRFYKSIPNVVDSQKTDMVAAFPPPEWASSLDEKMVLPPALTAGKKTVAATQQAVKDRIDECAGFTTKLPDGDCPFATDGEIDTLDGRRVTDLHGLKWTIKSYPEITMADDRSDETAPGFAISAAEPGTVTLTGSGADTDGNQVTFTVTCDINVTGLQAKANEDGDVTLSVSARSDVASGGYNTCRRNA